MPVCASIFSFSTVYSAAGIRFSLRLSLSPSHGNFTYSIQILFIFISSA